MSDRGRAAAGANRGFPKPAGPRAIWRERIGAKTHDQGISWMNEKLKIAVNGARSSRPRDFTGTQHKP
ncbi:MAG: hypothetical protein ACREIA_22275 [Opitutaceae bacterium]